jgi:hypothetical protein
VKYIVYCATLLICCGLVSLQALSPVLQSPEKLTELRKLGVSTPEFEKRKLPGLKFGGFVNTDLLWDSRQVFGLRDDHALYFPERYLPDVNCRDINASGDFNIVTVRSRVWANITGPQFRQFFSLGSVEVDFWGTNDLTIGLCRLRQAYVSLYDDFFTFLAGEHWHPIFVTEVFPAVLSFNTGLPFESLARMSQLRMEFQMNDTRMIFAGLSEAPDFKSGGPLLDTASTLTTVFDTRFCRNSMTPIFHAQLQQKYKKHVFGTGVDVKSLRPRLETTKGYKAHEWISSLSAIAYGMLQFDDLQIKGKVTYGQNTVSYGMLGGYGISYNDPITNHREYTNICVLGSWFEIVYNKKISPGLFVGIEKNLGARNSLAQLDTVPGATSYSQLIYGIGQDIDIMFRVSPRIIFTFKTLQVGAELEVTGARYGTVQRSGKVTPTHSVVNYRPLFAVFYYF